MVKNPPAIAGDIRDSGSILSRAWLPIPVFSPGDSPGQRSLMDYSPWGHKDSNMTKETWRTHTSV